MIQIPLHPPPTFLWLGKETSRSESWIHYSRQLTEFEFMLVDQGTLYIADEHGKYQVSAGEYILMPPCQHQYGWKNSCCSFYWKSTINCTAVQMPSATTLRTQEFLCIGRTYVKKSKPISNGIELVRFGFPKLPTTYVIPKNIFLLFFPTYVAWD